MKNYKVRKTIKYIGRKKLPFPTPKFVSIHQISFTQHYTLNSKIEENIFKKAYFYQQNIAAASSKWAVYSL